MAVKATPQTLIRGVDAKRALSWLHLLSIMGSWGGLVFILISLLPAQAVLSSEDWGKLMGSALSRFLPMHWILIPIAISTGILKILEHLTKMKDMGPALGTRYGQTILTKMLIGSLFLVNAMLITGAVTGNVGLGPQVTALIYLQVALGMIMVAFGVTLRNR